MSTVYVMPQRPDYRGRHRRLSILARIFRPRRVYRPAPVADLPTLPLALFDADATDRIEMPVAS